MMNIVKQVVSMCFSVELKYLSSHHYINIIICFVTLNIFSFLSLYSWLPFHSSFLFLKWGVDVLGAVVPLSVSINENAVYSIMN